MKRIVAAALAATAALLVMPSAHADTQPVNKAGKVAFFDAIKSTADVDCYTLTVSDKYRNWAMITFNADKVRGNTCVPFEGAVWFKRDATDQWQFVDSGNSDLTVGVPERVIAEFLPR